MARPTEIAGKAFGKLKGAKEAITGGVGIFKRLATEHGEITMLVRRVAASSKDAPIRAELLPKIRRELTAHAKAEEAEVYPVFRTLSVIGVAMDKSVTEHETVMGLLDQLEHMSTADDRWIEVFRDFAEKLHAHILDEEQTYFPRAKDALTRSQSEGLEERYVRAKRALLDEPIQ
jgi:hemerythrin superfamily protein